MESNGDKCKVGKGLVTVIKDKRGGEGGLIGEGKAAGRSAAEPSPENFSI